jgi:hypothetical protein
VPTCPSLYLQSRHRRGQNASAVVTLAFHQRELTAVVEQVTGAAQQ